MDDMKICLLNETKSFLFHFVRKLITLISFFSSSEMIFSFVCFGENKGIILQILQGKQKYQVTNVGVEKIKLSRLLVQRINEFKITEI